MKLNQKGITLIELLASLALVSIIAAIAWTALTTGFKHTAAETSKTQLQQEANLVITRITNEHRKNDHYYLQMYAGKLEIKTCKDVPPSSVTCGGFVKLTDGNYSYSGSINGIDFSSWDKTVKIDPKKTNVNFILKVADPAKPTRSVEIHTTLTRILTS
ncbi:prepilin-type N-terminal cleavage/methylation domain-containing protein [Planococcus shixiaomingii]|uniref:prepilin-type N-terminal cleavage/methylation domain-containing protein n=1 Tax=Planococcus shixiaomingii TaxID=3058393 RepID=UPI0026225840|nr:prepilin-type N-terminal cleavage/methylation domain-containing protein [Planococcus sp. N022]WKA56242.1 prepilin-type N-terminal cleavage/methylation domain-containing protein [Planococcus sp. N022]